MPAPSFDVSQVLRRDAAGLATYYNLICQARGFKLPPHLVPPVMALADPRITHLMLIVGPGCLTGDTIIGIERTRGSGLRKRTLEELYHKFNGKSWHVPIDRPCKVMESKPWDLTVPTRTLSWSNDRLAMNEIKEIIQSGIKEVYLLETESGNKIKASCDHPFFVPPDCEDADSEQYKKLSEFLPGDRIFVRNNDPYKGNILLKEDHVKSIKYIGKEMTYDMVMNDPYRNFLANDFIVHNSGKSMLLSEIFPSWTLGHDPMQTIIGISAGELLVQGFMKSVMEVIEFSDIYHAMFPAVRPDKGAGWSTERGMFVTGRAIGTPDSSYATAGLGSKALTGKHARLIICDDIHDAENSSNTENCQKVVELYYSTILGRADPRGARFILAGRRFNQEDIYGHLKDSDDFVVLELPAEREGTDKLWYDITIPTGLDCVFSEQLHKFEKERPARKRLKYKAVSTPELIAGTFE